ncbi:NUDIX domain-containing protein [Peristeroidobacter agariperforans]|uniref:NUDIX domain-containing protein n=1 Tax=Peristeroidobacter agariperforans TaxID=268404 RepID=UPI00101C91BF|nr:NUDIX hydrolase [Peristeroidobacter agariperforans]
MSAVSLEWALPQPIVNERDERLVSVIDIDETALHAFSPVTFALVIARDAAGFLLVLNSRRRVWELPGGLIEPGESARECALRELREESSQRVSTLRWRALLLLDLPGHASARRTEYGALFCGELIPDVAFVRNEEADEIGLWQPDALPTRTSAIDAYLLRLFR